MDSDSDPPAAGAHPAPLVASSRIVLRRHHLSHLPDLTVNDSVLEARYAPGSSPSHCDGTCCQSGVKVDVAHRDLILAHADLVRRVMEPGQEQDVAGWFEKRETPDPDFPSGRCVGTEVRGDGCVFLDSARRCVLQTATIAAARPGFDLKPFFCSAFPITIAGGALWIDEMCLDAPARCCRPTPHGPRGVLDVCATELAHVLGHEGLEELRTVVKR